MNYLLLYRVEFLRSIWEMKRYPFQTLAGLIAMGVIFFLFLGAGRIVSPQASSVSSNANFILTYVTAMISLSLFSMPSSIIWKEAKSGTLEHLYLSRYSLFVIFCARALGGLPVGLAQISSLLIGLLLITSTRLEWSLEIVPPLIVMIISALGLGMIFGGLALLIKDASGFLTLAQLPLLGLCGLPIIKAFWFYVLPIAPGATLLRVTALGGELSMESFAPALLSAISYLILGRFTLQKALDVARAKGLLGHE
jgi:ABC-2 type transport system permease protein